MIECIALFSSAAIALVSRNLHHPGFILKFRDPTIKANLNGSNWDTIQVVNLVKKVILY